MNSASSTSCAHEFGGEVAVIGRPAYTVAGLTAAAEATQRAVANGAPVVYQAAMFDGRFVGFADFLVRRDGQYRVSTPSWPARPRSPRCCSWRPTPTRLHRAGVPVAPEAELLLGDGIESCVSRRRSDPGVPQQRALLQRLLDEHLRRRHPGALGRRAGAGMFPVPGLQRAGARHRRSAARRRHASQPARQAD